VHNEPTVLDRAVDAGAVFWSLAEYWIHRLVFHGETPLEPMHQMHHALPKDVIGAASWMTFSSFSGVWRSPPALCSGSRASQRRTDGVEPFAPMRWADKDRDVFCIDPTVKHATARENERVHSAGVDHCQLQITTNGAVDMACHPILE
jgi:hypothetical protein